MNATNNNWNWVSVCTDNKILQTSNCRTTCRSVLSCCVKNISSCLYLDSFISSHTWILFITDEHLKSTNASTLSTISGCLYHTSVRMKSTPSFVCSDWNLGTTRKQKSRYIILGRRIMSRMQALASYTRASAHENTSSVIRLTIQIQS